MAVAELTLCSNPSTLQLLTAQPLILVQALTVISFDNVYVNGATITLVELLLILSQVESQLVPAVSASGVELVLTPSTSAEFLERSGTAYFWNADGGLDSINLAPLLQRQSLRILGSVYPLAVDSLLTSVL